MDILSDVLSTLRLHSSLYFRAEFGGAWSARVPRDPRTVRFHLLLQGECWVEIPGSLAPTLLSAGDVVLIPHGAEQVLSDAAGRQPVDLPRILEAVKFDGSGPLSVGVRPGERFVRMICGFCRFDPGADHALLRALPAALLLRASETLGETWLADALRYMSYESHSDLPGAGAILDRLADIVLIQGVRALLQSAAASTGFIAALRDRNLARALAAIHAAPERDWTVEALAREAGLSRSRFAELFSVRMGMPAARYLAEWRLQKARRLLSDTRLSVAEIAHRVGYESLPSFTRRFTRQFGVGPGRFRRVGLEPATPEAAAA
ncbi:MAG: AraC family transcriptional regulator [Reyranellaceae bacterium]